MRTGYNIREGSAILAARRVQDEINHEVADAILRRWKIQRLAREALRLLDEPVERAA
jgi:hypothetical protein